MLGEHRQLDRFAGRQGRRLGEVLVDQVRGEGEDPIGLVRAGEFGERRGGLLVEGGAVGWAGEAGFEFGASGEALQAVEGRGGRDLTVGVDRASGAVAQLPVGAVDDHGQAAVGQVGLAAVQDRPGSFGVVGVGNGVGLVVGESRPDPVEEVLGGSGWLDLGQVDAGGDLDASVLGGDDDQGVLGDEPDEVGDDLGEVGGVADPQHGGRGLFHRGLLQQGWVQSVRLPMRQNSYIRWPAKSV